MTNLELLLAAKNGDALALDTLIQKEREKLNKKVTPAQTLTAAKRIIKNSPRDDLRGVLTAKDGRAMLCDGFRAVRTIRNFDSLPAVKSDFAIEKIMDGAADNAGALLTLPALPDLKAVIAAWKATNKYERHNFPIYDFGADLPAVNAQYLLDIMLILPGCKIATASKKSIYSPIYFNDHEGNDAILCPIRKEAARV